MTPKRWTKFRPRFWPIKRYQQFADGGGEEEDDVSIPAPWTDADEAGLVALKNAHIKMADTSYPGDTEEGC